MVVIDEATQATEPAVLVALVRGAQCVVMAGGCRKRRGEGTRVGWGGVERRGGGSGGSLVKGGARTQGAGFGDKRG